LGFKIGKKMEGKIPLKNNSSIPVILECGFLAKLPPEFPYEVLLTTQSPTIAPQTQFFLNVQLKPKLEDEFPAEAR
jgi:hypothetical protein